MREILEAVASGELSPAAAEAELRGYATVAGGRYDAARTSRSGVPEAILASGKTPAEIGKLSETSLETSGRALVTRLPPDQLGTVRGRLDQSHPEARIRFHERAQVLIAYGPEFERPSLAASVAVVSAGTSDAAVAGEAAVIAREMGASVERVSDVGIAALGRLTDRLEELRTHDVLVVAAGREGALPTVVAGLVDVPVVGLPVSTGYGHGGAGEAALSGMLQSCTVLSVVNIDAGFAAGAQAGLIARKIASARTPEG